MERWILDASVDICGRAVRMSQGGKGVWREAARAKGRRRGFSKGVEVEVWEEKETVMVVVGQLVREEEKSRK